MKNDIAIAIRIGSPDTSLDLVRGTIGSIKKNIGTEKYIFVISLDPQIPNSVKEYISSQTQRHKNNFRLLPEETIYWSEFINKAIEKSSDCKYFVKAHDDILILTENIYPKLVKFFKKSQEPVAWVSFDDMAYLKGYWAPPTRPGFFEDYLFANGWKKRQLFQFHTLPSDWLDRSFIQVTIPTLFNGVRNRFLPMLKPLPLPEKKMSYYFKQKLDMPQKPVKAHAPWNMFVAIKRKVLEDIGSCEHWKTYNALLVDEDWGLRALRKGYWNVWMPNIKMEHVKTLVPGGGNRSQIMVSQDAKRVHSLFKKKWGFDSVPKTKSMLRKISKKYAKTNIPWSIGRNSFDWDYIN